jgi:acetoin utilization deacetylase AcuC-like enzyme
MGFCLVNNIAVAALHALATGAAQRVLVFDHDVHHGNGTEDVFLDDDRVLFQSFHLAPHYPGTGAAEVTGTGRGAGYTMNAPLAHGMGDAHARAVLLRAFLPAARVFRPDVVLISAGFDSLVGDPLGGLALTPAFFGEMVRLYSDVCPKVVCFLEGGYDVLRIPEPFEHELRALDGQDVVTGDDLVEPPSLAVLRDVHGARWGW